jgi:hypothetical protein
VTGIRKISTRRKVILAAVLGARLGPWGAAPGGGAGLGAAGPWRRPRAGGPGEPVQFRFTKPKRVAEASWLALVEGLS